MSNQETRVDTTDSEELREIVERQRDAIDRLERKVDALASELDTSFGGRCTRCEDGVMLRKDMSLVCSSCDVVRSL
ncbi:hypothetical protein HUG10_14980 [Halorarum halophilum]|uniref:Uncharacterized protein n=1 Tax=Halorarum halophilum TaxID=2743090 RepID=A0A7D5KNS8_9EURY|nr:hypothetical protein [Halobaculum halophilum]QLG28762.1 hypothetical protein HUG10_14980 [Halobaculum halophilum]